jgi:hypothetical protein
MALGSCSAPIALTPGLPVRGSTLGGLDARRASCARGTSRECAFLLDVTVRSELRATLETSGFDGVLTLFSEADLGHELRCVDDIPPGDVRHTRLDAVLSPGKYRILVDGANGEVGEFELFTELEPMPEVADLCAAAKPLTPGMTVRDATRGGHHLFSGSCGGGTQGPEHVYRLTVDVPSRVRIRQQSEYDGTLYLRAQCDAPRSELACNDDFQGNARSLLTAQLAPGSYFLFSDSYSREQSGDYVLALEQEAIPLAQRADAVCAEAARHAPIAGGHHEVDTLTAPSALAGSCGGEGAPERVLPIQLAARTTLAAYVDAAELNAILYVRRACADARSELACWSAPRIDHSTLPDMPPALIVTLDPGSYSLVVDGASAADIGAATLHLLFSPPTR